MDEQANEFGIYLKRKREQRGFSVNQLALKSGVSAAQISRIENAVRGIPKPETIQKLAVALKVDYQEMMEKAGHLSDMNDSTVEVVEDDFDDPSLGIWFKELKEAPKEKREELRRFWEFIKQQEENRKPGDKQ